MSKRKRGWYVRINGMIYCVTGARQERTLANHLRGLRAHATTRGPWPITYWDGRAWSDTGLVWHLP